MYNSSIINKFIKDSKLNRYVSITSNIDNPLEIPCEQWCKHSFKRVSKGFVKFPIIGKIKRFTINEYYKKSLRNYITDVYISIVLLEDDTHSYSFQVGNPDYNIKFLNEEMVKALYSKKK